MSSLRLLLKSIRVMKNWHIQLRESFKVWIPKNRIIKLRNGMTIAYRPGTGDRYSFNEVWLEESYNPKGFDWNSCKAIIDIGGNNGCAALYFHHKAPQAKVITCEPAEDNFTILKSNIERNGAQTSVTPMNIAVGGSTGTITLYLTKTTGGNSIYHYQNDAKPVEVPMKSLADLFADAHIDRCDLMKLDCEGAEYDILYNAPKDVLDRINAIVMEYHDFATGPKATPAELRAFLMENGFMLEDLGDHIVFAHRS